MFQESVEHREWESYRANLNENYFLFDPPKYAYLHFKTRHHILLLFIPLYEPFPPILTLIPPYGSTRPFSSQKRKARMTAWSRVCTQNVLKKIYLTSKLHNLPMDILFSLAKVDDKSKCLIFPTQEHQMKSRRKIHLPDSKTLNLSNTVVIRVEH